MEVLLPEADKDGIEYLDGDESIKKCQRCGTVIAKYPGTPWETFIRLKWCRSCEKIVRKRQKADWARKSRKDKRLIRRAERTKLDLLETQNMNLIEQNSLLKQENTLLRQRVMKLGGKLS